MTCPIRILILDDVTAIRLSLQAFLEDHEFTVSVAHSTETALPLLSQLTFHLAIVDLRLPGMNGADFIRQASIINPDMRFIIFSGSMNIKLPDDVLNLPQVSKNIFVKPVNDMALFCEEIQRLLNLDLPQQSPPPTILTIDDDESILESFSLFLEDCGYQALTAASLAEALACIERHHPDVILTDLHMPDMDGLQALRQISRLCEDTPIIVISGEESRESKSMALAAGAWEYITKPIEDMTILSKAITQMLSQKKTPHH